MSRPIQIPIPTLVRVKGGALDRVGLYLQAQALSACVRQLDDSRWTGTGTPQAPRAALRGRCAQCAIAALTLAAQRGLEDVPTSAFNDILAPLLDFPGSEKLADRLRETGLGAQVVSPGDAP